MNWDEVVGMMLILLIIPNEWEWWLFAFGASGFFDVVKPPPSHSAPGMKGGSA